MANGSIIGCSYVAEMVTTATCCEVRRCGNLMLLVYVGYMTMVLRCRDLLCVDQLYLASLLHRMYMKGIGGDRR